MWNLLLFFGPALLAAALSLVLAPLVSRFAVRIGAVDMPGERKIHTTPIPRLGGVAVVISIAAVIGGAMWLSDGRWGLRAELVPALTFGLLPVLAISVLDDIRSVSARRKFLAHTVGAVVAVASGVTLAPVVHLFGAPIHIGFLAAPLSVLWLVGVTNAFNIIDGLDGLSAGLALISAASMAAVFALVGQPGMSAMALVLAGALAGFLPYNTHPARMFLGDTGATAIGFCLGAFALKGGSTLSSGFAVLLPVFILGLPIADTLIAMARRSLARLERRRSGGMFEADGNHIHHRLLALGIDHGRAVLILYAVGLVFAAAAFGSVFLKAREAGLFVVALVLASFVGLHRLGYDEFSFIRRGTVLKVYEVPAVKRGMFVVFVDVVIVLIAAYLAITLKTDQWSGASVWHPLRDLAAAFAPVTVAVFWWSGMYRGSWRVAGIQDLTRVAAAVAIATVGGATLVQILTAGGHSASLFVIYGVLSLLLTASLRASYVILKHTQLRASHSGTPVLIYGAGRRGAAAVSELFKTTSAGLRPIGFIDDDAMKRGKLVSGLPVFGTIRELQGIIRTEQAGGLLVATEKIPAERLERASEVCDKVGASMFRLVVKVHRFGDESESNASANIRAALPPPVVHAPHPAETWSFGGIVHCPSCRSSEIHRSKARTFYERLRKEHTDKRLFRCQECDWRGWLLPLEAIHSPGAFIPLDLSSLDELAAAEPTAYGAALKIRDV